MPPLHEAICDELCLVLGDVAALHLVDPLQPNWLASERWADELPHPVLLDRHC